MLSLGYFDISPWTESDAVNGNSFSEEARASGYYEVAQAFHLIGTQWYRENVVEQPFSGDSEEQLHRFKLNLQSLQDFTPEFELLVGTRNAIWELLASRPLGATREELKAAVAHGGVTKFGVICNQLARGGFVSQQKEGKTSRLVWCPQPRSNREFLSEKLPAPGTSGMGLQP